MSKQRFTGFGTIAALAVVMLACGAARAALTYSLLFNQTTYTVTPGGQVTVAVTLQETGAAGDMFVLAPGGLGVQEALVLLSYPPGAPATVQTLADIGTNPAFPTVLPGPLGPTFANFDEFSPAPVFGSMVTPTTYDLFLGTFTLTAGPTPGSETITAVNPLLVAGTSAALPAANVAIATVDVSPAAVAVPEPANVLTALAGALAATGWVCWSLLRRRSPNAACESVRK